MMRDPVTHEPDMPATTSARWLAFALLALGILGFAAAWLLVALKAERQLAWLAPLAAADMVLLLAAVRWPPGRSRAIVAGLATLATIILANLAIIAGEVGRGMGLRPWESALRLGPSYAWELFRLATRPLDMAWYALALLVAGWAGFSARRRPAP
jgi:hypothetical protein